MDLVELSERASARSAVRVRQELMRRLDSLATVASIAPFLGLLGTVIGMLGMFRGTTGDHHTHMLAIMSELSDTLFPTAFSLLVAIPALMLYQYLRDQLEVFEIEMDAAPQVLATYLATHTIKP